MNTLWGGGGREEDWRALAQVWGKGEEREAWLGALARFLYTCWSTQGVVNSLGGLMSGELFQLKIHYTSTCPPAGAAVAWTQCTHRHLQYAGAVWQCDVHSRSRLLVQTAHCTCIPSCQYSVGWILLQFVIRNHARLHLSTTVFTQLTAVCCREEMIVNNRRLFLTTCAG